MTDVISLLWTIVILLAAILWKLWDISKRLKERYPTESEQDYEWSQKDPIGHEAAHRKDVKPR